MITRIIVIFSILLPIQIQALEVVDKYIEKNEIKRAMNRLFYLAKDMRNFTCIETSTNCLTPKDILDRITIIREKSTNDKELNIINRFIKERDIQNNIFMRSYTLFREKKYFEAITTFKDILKNYPKNIYALKYIAKSSLFTTDLSIAEYSYKQLIQIQQDDSDPYFELTAIYIKDKRYSLAEQILNLAKKRFKTDSRIPIYQNKIDDSKSFWKSMFASDEVESKIEEQIPKEIAVDKSSSEFFGFMSSSNREVKKVKEPVIQIIESEEKVKEKNSLGFSGLIELNKLVDNSILNLKIARLLIEEPIYGIDELSPFERNTIYLQPNINLIYSLKLFDSLNMDLRMNYSYIFYFNSVNNVDYGVLSPVITFKTEDGSNFIDLLFSQIQIDGNSLYSYGLGTTTTIFNTLFRFVYKINSFSNTNLDRDTFIFSTEHSFDFEDRAALKIKYLLRINSILTQSKIPYILTNERDENSTSSIYPTSYISHEVSINYLTKIFSHILFETGFSFEYRAFEVARSDMKFNIFTLFEYQLNKSNHIAIYFKRVDNISDEDGKEFDENIVGLNYKFLF